MESWDVAYKAHAYLVAVTSLKASSKLSGAADGDGRAHGPVEAMMMCNRDRAQDWFDGTAVRIIGCGRPFCNEIILAEDRLCNEN